MLLRRSALVAASVLLAAVPAWAEPHPSASPEVSVAASPIPEASVTVQPSATPSATASSTPTSARVRRLRAEQALTALGLPAGRVDGVWDEKTSRAMCVFRELVGQAPVRGYPSTPDTHLLWTGPTLLPAEGMVVGVNVNLACQTATWVVRDASGGLAVRRVFRVSTGMSGLDTRKGTFRVQRTVNGWWYSTIYEGAHMYRPLFFSGGQALHGSASDDLVLPYPASHGCVRVPHADMDALWKAGFGRGDRVRVYGVWK